MGGESDYDEGCGIGRGNRKSGGITGVVIFMIYL